MLGRRAGFSSLSRPRASASKLLLEPGLHTAQFAARAENEAVFLPPAFLTAGAVKIPASFGAACDKEKKRREPKSVPPTSSPALPESSLTGSMGPNG